jgi:hypothetical protein
VVPSDFAGIFSRYFVIGFFLPVFFALVLVAHLVDQSSTPNAYSSVSHATQVIILGGAGLLGGLLLLGVNQYVVRIFAGYPLQRLLAYLAIRLDPEGRMARVLLWPTVRNRLKRAELEFLVSVGGSTEAAVKLNQYFPWQPNEVMPTKLGNAIRAFESYPFKTYGLDGPPNWTRVEALVSENEKETLAESLTTFAFWLNLILLSLGAAIYVLIGGVLTQPHSDGSTLLLGLVTVVGGALLAWCAYCAALGAAVRWGASVRAAYDLHRLELYAQLGLKHPHTAEEERAVARAANRAASFGEKLPDAVRNNSDIEGNEDAG